jgi:hypothetical protein
MGVSITTDNVATNVYLAWTRPQPDQKIMYMSAPVRTTNFSHRQDTHETSYVAPQLAVYNGKLYMVWTGIDGNKTLNVKPLQ